MREAITGMAKNKALAHWNLLMFLDGDSKSRFGTPCMSMCMPNKPSNVPRLPYQSAIHLWIKSVRMHI